MLRSLLIVACSVVFLFARSPTQTKNQISAADRSCPPGMVFFGPAVNNICPVAMLLDEDICCQAVACEVALSNGPCAADSTCSSAGYACDLRGGYCCPVVDYLNPENIIGPAVGGICPIGSVMVLIPGGDPEGDCVSLQSIPGMCEVAVQGGPCPNGSGCTPGFTC
ncbi:hypothetical protein PFISCL1PPCAC_17672, partial [Pristionchus fissidentatus]